MPQAPPRQRPSPPGWAARGSSRICRGSRGQRSLAGPLAPPPASLPSSLSLSRPEISVWASVWALVRSPPPHGALDPEAPPYRLWTKGPPKGKCGSSSMIVTPLGSPKIFPRTFFIMRQYVKAVPLECSLGPVSRYAEVSGGYGASKS